ncbi:MAG: hypothetical protein IPM16_15940 [Chloroflexi bacterium]|nr:hypothetical protein [Chloroflexota bacterium]
MQRSSTGILSSPVVFEDRVDQQRMRGLIFIGFALLLIALPWLALSLLSAATAPDAPMARGAGLVISYVAPVAALVVYLTARRGLIGVASAVLVALLGLFAMTVMGGSLSFSSVIVLSIPMVAAGSLMRRTGMTITGALLVATAIVLAVAQRQTAETVVMDPGQSVLPDLLLVMFTLIVDSALLIAFAGWAPVVASDAQRDVIALQRVAAIGASLDINDEDRLLGQALSFVRADMKFPFAQFYLIGTSGGLDERVRLAVGSGQRIERAGVTALPETSAVREAATGRRSVRIDRTDTFIRRTHFLPTTVCGAVLPMVYGDTLLGVLDVQHEAVSEIPDYQLLTLQTLADNIAATLTTVRQSLSLKTTVREQQETTQSLRARLAELTSTGRRNQRVGQRLAGYDVSPSGALVPANDMPTDLRPVLESAELQVEQRGASRIVRLPITLRGETLGVMSFSLPGSKPLSERQLATARILAGRLALALENKRLIEQTRAQAEREALASGVANRLISATDVDSVLSTAVESFREVLGAVNSRIHVQPFQQQAPPMRDEPPASTEVIPSPLSDTEPVAGD